GRNSGSGGPGVKETVMNTRHQISRAVRIGLLGLLAAVGCFGCRGGQQDGPAGRGGDRIRVGLLPKIKGISYFTSCYEGAQQAAAELGNVELIYDGPTDGDPKKQAEMIETWIVDGIDVICI